jgi:hypothetical protein
VLPAHERDHPAVDEIREAIEAGGLESESRIPDLHVRRRGTVSYLCAVVVVTHNQLLIPSPARRGVAVQEEVVDSTIQVNLCNQTKAA